MKATGIVRKVDELGRIVIPKELRDSKGLEEGTPMEIFIEGSNIILREYRPGRAEAIAKLEAMLKEVKNPEHKDAIIKALNELN